ncbi:MAG: rRNA maturation RNase YbeY [Proteobacteria bacterium]|nr:rRNA maturation RNase YbeY [Pseudomonadota bacterium]
MTESGCAQIINKVRSLEICERLQVHHYEVCIQFVGPKSIRTLNKQFRQKDQPTDVLSFPQYNWKTPLRVTSGKISTVKRNIMNPMPLGDIVISLEDAERNSKESAHGLDQEVCFLMIHGLLHLVGHDHMQPKEKKLMFSDQRKLMKCFESNPGGRPRWYKCVTRIKKGSPKKNG